MTRLWWMLFLVGLLAPDALAGSRLDLRTSAVADLYFTVRTLAADDGAPVPEALAPAVTHARRIQAVLGTSLLAWGPVDRQLEGCATAHDLAERLAALPEPLVLFGGKTAAVGADLRALGAALVAAEPAFRATVWKEHEQRIDGARARLAASFVPEQGKVLAFHLEALGMADPGVTVPVHLVHALPWPGAVTHARVDGGGVVFVGIGDLPPGHLEEILLHEATHAFDVSTRGASHVLNQLRQGLDAAGLPAGDRGHRDLPHTVMFIQAAETVRRTMDPEHVHYGEAAGVYGRVPHAEAQRRIWTAHLDGKLTRADAVAEMVALSR
jgi:hypothetical protein